MAFSITFRRISRRVKSATKAVALHPHVRLFVFLVTFITLFTATIVKDNSLPTLNASPTGPSGNRAWKDLQFITQQPHPWNSRQNDVVRDYILSEMQKVAVQYDDIIVDDDRSSMVLDNSSDLLVRLSGSKNVTVTYFEGLNILVRIPGTSKMSGAILLSAHFDSVSTALGSTDDGMGTVSCMELVRYFAEHRTKRDIIVNINNGEEDFLWGAKAFANHRWSKDAIAFVNLEGAGAGGPALLFRTSNAVVAQAYRGTPYPRVSQLGNDFFKSGLIRSETDFVIYEQMNGGFTPGLDVAFYRPRALYHTPFDDIHHTSEGSLQHMLLTGLTIVTNLGNNVAKNGFAVGGQPVYFDFLGGGTAQIRMGVLWIWNLVLLLVCPWILGISFYGRNITLGKVLFQGFGVATSAVLGGAFIIFGIMGIMTRTSVPLVYTHPILVLGFALLVMFIAFYLIVRLHYLLRPSIQKSTDDAERVTTWEMMVICLIYKIGFIFFVPISFLGVFLAALTTLFEPSSFAEPLLVNGDLSGGEIDASDETTPLLRDEDDDQTGSMEAEEERLNSLLAPKSASIYREPDWRNWLWLVRFGLMVPLQALIGLELIVWEFLPGLHQTITDGTPVAAVFLSIGFFAFISLVNTIPFLLRLPFKSTAVLLVPIFVASIIAVSAPSMNQFNPSSPFKTFYRSTYDLDSKNSTGYLHGLDPYIDRVLRYIPTANTNGYVCQPYFARGGRSCRFTIPEPIPPTGDNEWFKVTSTIEPESDETDVLAKVQILTNSTRVCFLEFDTYDPPEIAGIGGVRFYRKDIVTKNRCTTLRMFKRTWGEEPFSVLLKFKRKAPGNVTVVCGYDEWSPGGGVGVVRSLDEIWHYLPAWASVTKLMTGLLQVRKAHKIF